MRKRTATAMRARVVAEGLRPPLDGFPTGVGGDPLPSAGLESGRPAPTGRSTRIEGRAREGERRSRLSVERDFADLFPVDDDVETHLAAVVRDTLRRRGSLVRARLCSSLLLDLGAAEGCARALGMAVEYFHTASLLFDDLPCMDDARERRGAACAHLVHGEAAAVLAGLAFVSRGYALLWEGITDLPRAARRRISSLVADCVGVNGILDGQSRDLHFQAATASGEAVERVAEGKTVPLIRLTLLLPVMAAGLDVHSESRVGQIARCWGLAYQILDDFKDGLMTDAEVGKSTRRDRRLARPNLPVAVGDAAALARLVSLLGESAALVEELSADWEEGWRSLRPIQELLAAGLDEVRRRLGEVRSSHAARAGEERSA